MDVAGLWDGLKSSLGLDDAHVTETVTKAIQILVLVILTLWIAHWASEGIRRAARSGRVYAEVGALASRAVTLVIYGLGATVILAVLGASWTAIAAILGAATFGISLALQDVGRSFVNGIYILIERPFRIGDRVRIGLAEGRVEEVGVRLTALRTDGGERIIVPNTVVFSSVIENSSVGQIERQRYRANGIINPVAEIDDRVRTCLRGVRHLTQQPPTVTIVEAGPEGTSIEVTVEHELGHRIDHDVIDRLRAQFPEATVMVVPAAPIS